MRPLAVVVSLALACPALLAHGGQYKAPPDAVGAGAVGGGTVVPPTNPGGAATATPGGATGGDRSGDGGRSGGDRVGGRGESGRGGSTTGARTTVTRGFDGWEFWWEANKDRFLALKSRLVRDLTVTGSVSALTGQGRRERHAATRRPTRDEIARQVVPALRELLADESDRDVLDSILLALARSADAADAGALADEMLPLLAHRELSVQSAAALALGVLGHPATAGQLADVLTDSSAGRQLTGGPAPELVRAFAALSLGLLGAPGSAPVLVDVLARTKDGERDVKVCSVVALGLLPAEQVAAHEVVAALRGALADRRLDPLVQSYVPTALARLGARGALGPEHGAVLADVLSAFTSRDSDLLVQQSCAIALGLLAGTEDAPAVAALFDAVEQASDRQTRHFALIALGELGARDEAPQRSDDVRAVHERLVDVLRDEIAGKGKDGAHRPWAALAAAIYVRGQPAASAVVEEYLLAAYERENDPSFRGAFALALGLTDSTRAADRIFEDFLQRRDEEFQGHAGLALGFLGHRAAAERLRATCSNKSTTPSLRLASATALGLLSDTGAVPVLVATLEDARTLGVTSAAAQALGLLGDRESIPSLLGIAQDGQRTGIVRGFACVALGLVGERGELPWNEPLKAHNNYRAQVPSILEVLDIL